MLSAVCSNKVQGKAASTAMRSSLPCIMPCHVLRTVRTLISWSLVSLVCDWGLNPPETSSCWKEPETWIGFFVADLFRWGIVWMHAPILSTSVAKYTYYSVPVFQESGNLGREHTRQFPRLLRQGGWTMVTGSFLCPWNSELVVDHEWRVGCWGSVSYFEVHHTNCEWKKWSASVFSVAVGIVGVRDGLHWGAKRLGKGLKFFMFFGGG